MRKQRVTRTFILYFDAFFSQKLFQSFGSKPTGFISILFRLFEKQCKRPTHFLC